MKLTNKITAIILLLLSLTLLSSCLQRASGSQGETGEGNRETEQKHATTSNTKTEEPAVLGVSPEVEDAFTKALAAIISLDNETMAELEDAYQTQYGYPLALNDVIAEPGDLLGGTFCYGKFDECIVIFSPTMLTVVSSKTIADEVFSYGSSFALYGYHDGMFYSLEEAYEKGFLTKDEVAIAAECHRTIGRYNGLRAYYEKAISALIPPEEDTRKSIVEAFSDGGSSIEWISLDNKEQFASPHLRSYGDFNGCTVLLMTLQSEDKNTQIIADSSFEYSYGNQIKVWVKGQFLNIVDAYGQKFITKDMVANISDIHNNSKYLSMNDNANQEFKLKMPSQELQERFVDEYVAYRDYDPEDNPTVAIESWYGSFGDIHFLFVFDGQIDYSQAYWTDNVAESSFAYADGQSILVWVNKQFLTMKQAYEQDLITVDMIKTIENVHEGIDGSPIIMLEH